MLESTRIRTFEQYKNLAIETFQEIDWEQINLIANRFQIRAGITDPKNIYPTHINFKNLGHGRVMHVSYSTTFAYNSTTISIIENNNPDLVLSIDLDFFLDLKSTWYKASNEEVKGYFKESFIHEYAHMISDSKHEIIHNDVTNDDVPHTIIKSGLKQTEIVGRVKIGSELGGRINDVITEYLASKIQYEYMPTQEFKRIGSYYPFKLMFNILILAISKSTDIDPELIYNSLLKCYFDGTDITSTSFYSNLTDEIQLLLFELLKSERDSVMEWEYAQTVKNEFQILKKDIDELNDKLKTW